MTKNGTRFYQQVPFLRLGTLKNHEPAGGFCERQTVSGFIVDEKYRCSNHPSAVFVGAVGGRSFTYE